MGLQWMINEILSLMIQVDSTTSRTLAVTRKRAVRIAENLEQSEDIERQNKFKATFISLAEQLKALAGKQPDSIPNRMEPRRQMSALERIEEVDKELNEYEAPPSGHPETMAKATEMDLREVAIAWEGMKHGSDGFLRQLADRGDAQAIGSSQRTDQHLLTQTDQPYPNQPKGITETLLRETGMPSTSYSQVSIKAYAEVAKRINPMRDTGNLEPTVKFYMSEMTLENAEALLELNVSYDHTFAELSNILVDNDLTRPLPDLWLRRCSNEKNRVTDSHVWWECQKPKGNVSEAIYDQQRTRALRSGVGIKSVITTGGEYVVVLIKKDGTECEMPTEIPKSLRRFALEHFSDVVFPADSVIQVLELESGRDAAKVVFDGNSFDHKTNPLYVEMSTGKSVATKGKFRATAV